MATVAISIGSLSAQTDEKAIGKIKRLVITNFSVEQENGKTKYTLRKDADLGFLCVTAVTEYLFNRDGLIVEQRHLK